MLDYSSATTLINERLQSAGTADYTVSEVNNALTYALTELSQVAPHKVGISFKLEGRRGTATATSANNLVDTTNGSFLSTDPTNEKVVFNATDSTWAVILSQASTSQVGLTADIFAAQEQYEIFNKHCVSHNQLYIGDVPSNYSIQSVEYPIGTKRNWKQDGDVLEVDIKYVPDTNSNTAKITTPANAEVLVKFGLPHALPNLTDWSATFAATAAVGATTVSATALQSSGTINVGTEFTIQYHKQTYIVASSVTIASNTAAITFYPGLESNVSSTAWTMTVRKTSIEPQYEDIVADIAVGRCMINRAPEFVNAINIGGGQVYQNLLAVGERRLTEALSKLKRSVPPKTSRRYPVD